MKAFSLWHVLGEHWRSGSAWTRNHFPWQWGAGKAEKRVVLPSTPCPWHRHPKFLRKASDSHFTQILSPKNDVSLVNVNEQFENDSYLLSAPWNSAPFDTLWTPLVPRIRRSICKRKKNKVRIERINFVYVFLFFLNLWKIWSREKINRVVF